MHTLKHFETQSLFCQSYVMKKIHFEQIITLFEDDNDDGDDDVAYSEGAVFRRQRLKKNHLHLKCF